MLQAWRVGNRYAPKLVAPALLEGDGNSRLRHEWDKAAFVHIKLIFFLERTQESGWTREVRLLLGHPRMLSRSEYEEFPS